MKKIIIVGASSGIGHRVAEDFLEMGFNVGLAARSEAPLKALKEKYPATAEYEVIDVTARDSVNRLFKLIHRMGGIDTILVASGVGFTNPELKLNHEINTLETNVVGFARMVSAAYRYFRDYEGAGSGQIAAITSVAGTKGIGVAASYSASKRFQQTYLEALEQLAHKQQVDVAFTDIRPGFVNTPILSQSKSYPMEMDVEYAAKLIEAAILKRKRVATVDWRWACVTALWRLIPSCLWTRMDVDMGKSVSSNAEPLDLQEVKL
ncbi:MAG: SDR family NAD(P)-dependent oxidoreductase [Lachnoclostridium sp.]|nr:SDR family NAD(P)-dependent oxidoreductase [Lachnoclostridium sp.]